MGRGSQPRVAPRRTSPIYVLPSFQPNRTGAASRRAKTPLPVSPLSQGGRNRGIRAMCPAGKSKGSGRGGRKWWLGRWAVAAIDAVPADLVEAQRGSVRGVVGAIDGAVGEVDPSAV